MACKGDCCKRVAALEAQRGKLNKDLQAVREELDRLVSQFPTLLAGEVVARIRLIRRHIPFLG